MPTIFRAMQADGDGPMIGHTQNDTLGVRETDVRPVDGLIQPGTGGMSVSPRPQDIPPHLIPKRFRQHGYPQARRNNKPDTSPWRLGEGPFVKGQLCEKLQLGIDSDNQAHGFVEPDSPATLDDHRTAVEATQPNWVREEWIAADRSAGTSRTGR